MVPTMVGSPRRKGPFFAATFSRPFKDQAGAWHNGASFGLNDREALITDADRTFKFSPVILSPSLEIGRENHGLADSETLSASL
jgi:hypothetical protein